MVNANKIVINTFLLYSKSILIIFVSLFSTRIILNTLGVKDFGLFNLVGGLVVMLSFLNISMAASTQRFLSFNKGTDSVEKVRRVFANSFLLHLFISILVIIFLETFGMYILNNSLNISDDRVYDSTILFHTVVAIAFVTIVSIPYDAILNSNEDMLCLSIASVIDSVLKLVASILIYFLENNRLIIYGFCLFVISIIISLVKIIYVKKKYEESNVNFIEEYDKDTIKEITYFASWNLLGVFSYIGRTEGLVLLFNLFYGVLVNAAYAISIQVSSQINVLSMMMFQAVNPQIVKSEGGENREKMISLVIASLKFGFYLLSLMAIPFIFEMKEILSLWLVNVPVYTEKLCIYILITLMINQLTSGIDSAMYARGDIKKYIVKVGLLKLLILPSGFIILKLGFSIDVFFGAYIIFEILAGLIRLLMLEEYLGVSVKTYWKNVILKILPFFFVEILFGCLFTALFEFSFRFIFTIIISVGISSFTIYMYSLEDSEKLVVDSIVAEIKEKLKNSKLNYIR